MCTVYLLHTVTLSLVSVWISVSGTSNTTGNHQCHYGYDKVYSIGDIIQVKDGCNRCLCTENGFACTGLPCSTSGFANGSIAPLYGECTYENKWYKFHSQWRASDGCNTCVCVGIGNYRGPHVCTTGQCCHQNGNIQTKCSYNQRQYHTGDVIEADDHCNKCLCTENGLHCTRISCSSSGFAQPSKEPLYGECLYNGGWYHVGSQWLTADGCNTCACVEYGNYQGHFICTSGTCCEHSTHATVLGK